ncbi:Hypothetical protein FKW44_004380 [Caligus rogercresseyi]|uniref:Uncharacterized protein n=1 Tax=Caligus rogercresseyi TaxID=217165 RepID=A0A7T8HMP3_CALRO|nr:Hypothetical protein FKW44_004380 [Caligus rogercresseyi]
MIMDTTQDVAKVDQMSQIFRYVVIERDSQGLQLMLQSKNHLLAFVKLPTHPPVN